MSKLVSYVYVIGPAKGHTGNLKIGKSDKPYSRVGILQTGSMGVPLEVKRTFKCDSPEQAHIIEKAAHSLIHQERQGGEWFSVSEDKAVSTVFEAIAGVERGWELIPSRQAYKKGVIPKGSFPKPLSLVRMQCVNSLMMYKIINFIFKHVYEHPSDRRTYVIGIGDVSVGLKQNDYDSVRGYFKEIAALKIEIDGVNRPIFENTAISDCKFAFTVDEALVLQMSQKRNHVVIDHDISKSMNSRFGLYLYERLLEMIKLKKGELSLETKDAVHLFNWPKDPDGSFQYKNFKTVAAESAVNSVNKLTPFNVEFFQERNNDKDKRKVTSLKFKIVNETAQTTPSEKMPTPQPPPLVVIPRLGPTVIYPEQRKKKATTNENQLSMF